MADDVPVSLGENSPEGVAFKLFRTINEAEGFRNKTREQLLTLYAECLQTVRNPTLYLEAGDTPGAALEGKQEPGGRTRELFPSEHAWLGRVSDSEPHCGEAHF